MAGNQGDAAKAYRLRQTLKRGQQLKPTDALWLSEYEDDHPPGPDGEPRKGRPRGRPKIQSFGASAAGKKVKLEIEEHAASVGTGNAAVEAAAAALAAKEEGRRLDSLTVNAVGALRAAVDTYKEICASMHERLQTLEQTHIAMLESVRDHFLARTDAEAALAEHEKDQQGEPLQAMALAMIAKHLGVDIGALGVGNTGARNGAQGKKS